MSFNAKSFLEDYQIPYFLENDKNVAAGWVGITCPQCDDTSSHGGFSVSKAYYKCWRCGFHPLPKIIAVITGVNFNQAKGIIKKYSAVSGDVTQRERIKNTNSHITFPSDTGLLTNKAKKYLISRKFDPEVIAKKWGILSTGRIGFYKNRILAPIYQNQRLVSYQCRDITGKAGKKYLACKQEEEIIQHQHTIYGFDQAVNKSKICVVVEGITDVWRLGAGAVGTFGISFTSQQAQLIAMNFNRVFILYDGEPQAQEQADYLGFLVSSSFTNAPEVINFCLKQEGIDPGDLQQDAANALMHEVGL